MSNPGLSDEPIPRFTIDLAWPPRERYDEVVEAFGPRMRSLTGLFDNVLSIFIAATWLRSVIIGLSRFCLRRVYDDEENEEIQGIAAASGVPLYLLVALNNLLDCLLGCTSGAVPVSLGNPWQRTARDGTDLPPTRLLHFRTLDWGMDELRDLLVVLEFVDSASDYPGRVIARSITYAGFVGALTAVKPGLSISLNQRPCHDCSTRRLHWHQLMVLLGRRRSVGSIVRTFMLRPSQKIDGAGSKSGAPVSRFVESVKSLTLVPSAPCYLILCDGREAALVVKDCNTGTVRSTRGFIAQTNHDPGDHEESVAHTHGISPQDRRKVITSSFGVPGWIDESTDRLECLQKKWSRFVARHRARKSTPRPVGEPSIKEKTLRRWILDPPTLNECSHFITILDPATGNIRWLVRGQLD